MHDKEAIEMMQRCSSEIKMLRREVERLAPKAEAYEVLAMTITTMAPRRAVGAGEDLAWLLDRKIKELQKESEREQQPEH